MTCFGYCFSPSSGCLWVSPVSYTCNVTWVRWGALGELSRECGQGCVGVMGSVVDIPFCGLILSLCLKFVCLKLIAMLVCNIEGYSVMLVTSQTIIHEL
jgi:hypothetical protein